MKNNDARPQHYSKYDPHLHGSAQWATRKHLKERGYGQNGHHFLGYGLPERAGQPHFPITYGGARHFTTIAPTRSGKSVSALVPNIMRAPGSSVILDVKSGELAMITARYRQSIGHNVALYDPYDAVASRLGMKSVRINLLDDIEPNSDHAFDDAFLLADALIIPERQGESHWSVEAQALVAGLSIAVKCRDEETIISKSDLGISNGDIGDVRAILNMNASEFFRYINGTFADDGKILARGMMQSHNPFVRAAAGRLSNKAEKELSGVISTAQKNTHFLESPLIRRSLSDSTFDLKELGNGKTDLYIILPADRLPTSGRLIRALLSKTLMTVARLPFRPNPPVYFVIEEMAALGRLEIVESSYGLMAGFGLQLHGLWQDLSQAKNLYPNSWQTFIANSACIQAFGTRDAFTADYLSKMCGRASIEQISAETADKRASLFGDPKYFGEMDRLEGRPLITPEEIMTLHPGVQLLILAGANPVMAYKTAYFLDRVYRDRRDRPLYSVLPEYQTAKPLSSYDFTSPKLNVGALLDHHIKVG